MKKLYFLFGVIFTIATIVGISYLGEAIFVDTYTGENTHIARITTDPTGYGITLEMLGNRYSEFSHMDTNDVEWVFHFNMNALGEEQRDNFAGILESVMKVDARFFATENHIYRCKPEYISQLDRIGILCDELF